MAPMTPDALKQYLINAPRLLQADATLSQQDEHQILTHCYRALWHDNQAWMQQYFLKDNHDTTRSSLTERLHHGGLFPDVATTTDTALNNSDDHDQPEYGEGQRGKQCGHLFKNGESVYRCKNCGLDETCVLCSRCFHATDHHGHDVKMWIGRGAGGCCDCGDPEAWKVPLKCRIHGDDDDDTTATATATDTTNTNTPLPTPLLDSIHATIAIVLDYLLETLATMPEDMTSLQLTDDVIQANDDALAALGMIAENKYVCVLWNDDRHSFDEVQMIVKQATGCSKTTAQRTADSVDAYGRHMVYVSSHLNDVMRVANHLQNFDLAISVRSTTLYGRELVSGLLLAWLQRITGISLVLRDAVCQMLCDSYALPSDLATSSIRTRRTHRMDDDDDMFDADELDLPENDHDDDIGGGDDGGNGHPMFMMDEEDGHALDMEDIAEIIGDDDHAGWESHDDDVDDDDAFVNHSATTTTMPATTLRLGTDIADLNYDIDDWFTSMKSLVDSERAIFDSIGGGGERPCLPTITGDKMKKDFEKKLRLDYLLHFDLRLWKSARVMLKDLLIGSLISNFDYRPILGVRFARNYPMLMDAFFFKDREPGQSILSSMAVQLLTVPSVAGLLTMDYDFFAMVCTLLAQFFVSDKIQLNTPITTTTTIDAKAITRHRYAYTFIDLRYVLHADIVKTAVPQHPMWWRHVLDLLTPFQGMDPLTRQTITHIEFESSTWVSAFNATLQLSQLCRLFTETFASSTTVPLHQAIRRVFYHIITHNDQDQYRFHTLDLPYKNNSTVDVVDYSVAKNPTMSFHHPLHLLLSNLLNHVDSISDVLLGHEDMSNQFLQILEPPLRTLVLLAQIHAGVWVRNGYGVRLQARTYRDISIRETTLDRDISLVQAGFMVMDGDMMLGTVVDRFGLWGWLVDGQHDYEPTQLTCMVEELLHLLVTVATQRITTRGMSIEAQIRRSIIQYLGLKPMAYSELTKHIPDSLSDHETFEPTLASVATFRAPGDGLNDHGVYVLDPALAVEVDPYFWHYTRNQREEALSKQQQQHLVPYVDGFMHSATFCHLITHTLGNDHKLSDSVLETTLYLATLATNASPPNGFIHHVTANGTFLEVLLRCFNDPQRRHLYTRHRTLLDRLEQHAESDHAKTMLRDFMDQQQQKRPLDHDHQDDNGKKRKAAAKARQDAIMTQFAQAQSKFLAQHGNDMVDDDDEHEEETCLVCQEPLDATRTYGMLALSQLASEHHDKYVSSCGHLVHEHCFRTDDEHQWVLCPLCKAVCNLLVAIDPSSSATVSTTTTTPYASGIVVDQLRQAMQASETAAAADDDDDDDGIDMDAVAYTLTSLEFEHRHSTQQQQQQQQQRYWVDAVPAHTIRLLGLFLLRHQHRRRSTFGMARTVLGLHSTGRISVLCDDPFRVLTYLSLDDTIDMHHVMRLLLMADLARSVMMILMNNMAAGGGGGFMDRPLHRFANYIATTLGTSTAASATLPDDLEARVRTMTLPFLRKCLLLMTVLNKQQQQERQHEDEYDQLLVDLDLPPLDTLVDVDQSPPFEKDLLTRWCPEAAGIVHPSTINDTLALDNPLATWVQLPERLDQLLDDDHYMKRICPACKSVPEDPALCLFCGTVVCARSACCTVDDEGELGECNTHMKFCGGEVGMYLVLKDCLVLLLHDHDGGTIMSAPYLDSHGEPDMFLQRGGPQYLNTKRYEQLRHLYLSHSIPAFVRRRMEDASRPEQWESW
ncbi:unnamed protein product [Absidia cylindrospora]